MTRPVGWYHRGRHRKGDALWHRAGSAYTCLTQHGQVRPRTSQVTKNLEMLGNAFIPQSNLPAYWSPSRSTHHLQLHIAGLKETAVTALMGQYLPLTAASNSPSAQQ